MNRTGIALLGALLCATGAGAQSKAVQRALIQRDQQSDEFSLQLRQYEERLSIPAGDAAARTATETRQLEERQRLQNLDTQQLQQAVAPGTYKVLRPYQRQKAAAERHELVQPPASAPTADPR
jgi:hypothetical protein